MKFARLPLVAVHVVALAIGGGVLTAQPAYAGETHWFETNNGTGGGWAEASVTIDFLSKNVADLKGRVRDVCPGDGKGAYVDVSYLTDTWSYSSSPFAKDTNGCGDTYVRFDPAPVRKGGEIHRLKAIRVTVCERDNDGGGATWCDSHVYDNWRV